MTSEYPMPTMLEQWIYHLYFYSVAIALLVPAILFNIGFKWSRRFSYRIATATSLALQVPVFVFLVATLSMPWPSGLPLARFAGIFSWLLQLGGLLGFWYRSIRKLPRQRISGVWQESTEKRPGNSLA